MIDFTTLEYLRNGNKKQLKAYEILCENEILEKLSEFDPILVGTIPIEIDIENSDLDIICYWKNKAHFITTLNSCFGQKSDFKIQEATINDEKVIVTNFTITPFEIEIFGQNMPTKKQNGYRHMIVEHEILQSKGENFRLEIIKLKQKGCKTEPAFGLLLNLKNPYKELLEYKI